MVNTRSSETRAYSLESVQLVSDWTSGELTIRASPSTIADVQDQFSLGSSELQTARLAQLHGLTVKVTEIGFELIIRTSQVHTLS